jgi:hypothetical protein
VASLSQVALVGLAIGGWFAAFLSAYQTGGLFRWLGIDFGIDLAQSQLLQNLGGSRLYDFDALGRQLQSLVVYTAQPGLPLPTGPVPFPPIYAWLFIPLTRLSPPLAFVLWAVLNVLVAAHMACLAAHFFPRSQRLLVIVLVLTSFPLAYAMFVGQPVLLLACAFGEAYISFLDGRDFRAGLWMACLLIKPQYGLLIGPILVWKRRRAAVVGVMAGGCIVLAGSLLAAGLDGLRQYPSSMSGLAHFDGKDALSYASQMINWRGALLRVAPDLPAYQGLLIVGILSLLTLLAACYVWRRPWDAAPGPFAAAW